MKPPLYLVDPTRVRPGDILVVRDRSWAARLIRWGAGYADQPNVWNHVVVASHIDAKGNFWGVEGKPSRVGEVVINDRIGDRWTLANIRQDKTDEQRARIVEVVRGMLGRPYDWTAIVHDAMETIHADALWGMRGWAASTGVPTHVVCSSLATYGYQRAGLACAGGKEGGGRWATPYDWAQFIIREGWSE